MEDLSITSDISGDVIISSTNTSLSGLTGYEEEFNDLRSLAVPTATSPRLGKIPGCDDIPRLVYETKIKNLTSELQSTLKLNEKLKDDLFSTERRCEEENKKRIQTLITKNAQLEAHLAVVGSHIEGLLKRCVKTKLEKASLDLYEQIKLIQDEILKCNSDRSSNELLLRNIKSELEIAKGEVQARVVCVNELKKKVSEQYASIETVSLYNKELESKLQNVKDELGWCKKSENWYRGQVHSLQSKIGEKSEEIIKLQQLLFVKDQEQEKLNIEAITWKHKYEELQILFKKERDGLLGKIETLKLEVLNKSADFDERSNDSACHTCNGNENLMQGMSEELVNLKEAFDAQNKMLEELRKEKPNFHARITFLQKQSSEKELLVHHLEQQKIDLQIQLRSKQMLEQNQNKEILNLKGLNDTLKIKLAALSREKEEIENAVSLIREDFSKVLAAHTQLRQSVLAKEKTIHDLQKKMQELMVNNWQNCETESIKQNVKNTEQLKISEVKDETEIEELRNAVSFLKGTISEFEVKYEATVLEKEKIIENLRNDLSRAELKSVALMDSLQVEKTNLLTSEQSNDQLRLHLKDKEVVARKLGTEIDNLKVDKTNLRREVFELREKIRGLEIQTASSKSVRNSLKNDDENANRVDCLGFTFDKTERVIGEILELIYNKLLKMETDGLCKEDINIEMKKLSPESTSFLLLQTIMTKLFDLDTQIRKNMKNVQNQKVQDTLSNFSDYLFTKMHSVLDKCNSIDKKAENCSQILKSFRQKVTRIPLHYQDKSLLDEEIVKRKTQEREMKDKIKRYEINNHTLLKKAKEHLKARNAAEKHSAHLQALYTSLMEAYNAMKFEFSNKTSELEQSGLVIANLKLHIGELQETVCGLEKQLVELKVDCGILKSNANEKQNSLCELERLLSVKNKEIDDFRDLSANLEYQILQLKTLNAELSGSVNALQVSLHAAEKEYEQLRALLKNSEADYVDLTNKLNNTVNLHQQSEGKNRCLVQEIEVLKQTLKNKDESLENIQNQKTNTYQQSGNSKDLQNTVNKLNTEVQRLNNDKWFLQRLCNDLKCALQASVNEKQVLKAQALNISARTQCNGLQDLTSNLPVPSKCNDALLKQLLEKSIVPYSPLTVIEEPLKSLKLEINNLKERFKRQYSFET